MDEYRDNEGGGGQGEAGELDAISALLGHLSDVRLQGAGEPGTGSRLKAEGLGEVR